MKFWSGDKIEKLQENEIFVFGSNPTGFHGWGGAKSAVNFGAKNRVGRGLCGQTYALVTKNLKGQAGYLEESTGIVYDKEDYKSVSPEMIIANIKEMYDCARQNPHLEFIITYKREQWPNGSEKKSLNGYTPSEMIDMFIANEIPDNIVFHDSYKEVLNKKLAEKQKNAETNFTNENHVFSFYSHPFHKQYPSLFNYKERTFVSLEHFMVYSKIKMCNDLSAEKELNKIMEKDLLIDFKSGKITSDEIIKNVIKSKEWTLIMNDIKNIGKKCVNFNPDLWNSKKISIMTVGNREKINQNSEIKNLSESIKNKNIIFASNLSQYSGIGLAYDNPDVKNINLWKGKNELGLSLNQAINVIQQSNKTRPQP